MLGNSAKYAEDADYGEYAKYAEYVEYAEYAKYADWLKQSTPGSLVPSAMFSTLYRPPFPQRLDIFLLWLGSQ